LWRDVLGQSKRWNLFVFIENPINLSDNRVLAAKLPKPSDKPLALYRHRNLRPAILSDRTNQKIPGQAGDGSI
jgi:hypothetical protein